MLPNINPRNMQKMMKRMGLKQEEIPAEEVIIKLQDKELVISNPKVSKIEVMGQTTLQITGDIQERSLKPYTEDDINLVVKQANVSKEKAEKTLQETQGNLAEAILKLKR